MPVWMSAARELLRVGDTVHVGIARRPEVAGDAIQEKLGPELSSPLPSLSTVSDIDTTAMS